MKKHDYFVFQNYLFKIFLDTSRKHSFFILLLSCKLLYAQVGINTEFPQTALDVNGSVQFRQEFQVDGNPGQPGEIYFSKGNIEEPEWKPVNVPFLEEGQYQLVNTYAKSDQLGIDYYGSIYGCTIKSFPFAETFESNSSTRNCWAQIQEAGNVSWSFATGAGEGNITTAHGGTLNARFIRQSGSNTPRTKLVSPVMDLSNVTNPRVRFWYGQQQRTELFIFNYQNRLRVFYRTSPSSPWVQIGSDYSNNISSWSQVNNLALPNPSSTYQIAFEGVNYNGNPNVLDDVEVYGDSPVSTMNDMVNYNSYDPVLSSVGEIITDKNWKRIPGLDTDITINSNDNKISVIFQTGVESRMNAAGNGNQVPGNIRFICGLFKRETSSPLSSASLVAIRGDQINNTINKPIENKAQSIFTLNYTVDNIPSGDYTFSVACRRLSLTDGGGSEATSLLSIGNAVNSGNNVTNDFMLNSILKMDIIELVMVSGL